jgi:Mce-associated membrane protein
VREPGVTRPEGDRAVLLAFVDQTSTRPDQGRSAASGSRPGFQADRLDGGWEITGVVVFNRPLPVGDARSQC